MKLYFRIFFFFFQAEDGIRDKLVTGVQTCALPISDESITVAGALVGTVDYMPPEQLAGKEITAATDLYAAAMVIYEAYTGRHWEITDRPERAVWSGVPRGVAAVLQHALAFAPEGRYPDATAFRRALWHTRERMYQWRTVGLTIAGLVAGAVGAVWLLHRWQEGVWPVRPPGALDVVVDRK